jgi:hypothetical protein
MAGGMRSRRDGASLVNRVGRMRGEDPPCPMRHVWVADPADRSGAKRPGLLVMWRRTERAPGWEALVLYGAELRSGEWAIVQEWVGEALLTQA